MGAVMMSLFYKREPVRRLEDDNTIFIVWDEWRTARFPWWYGAIMVAIFMGLPFVVNFQKGSAIPLLLVSTLLAAFLFYAFVPFVHTRPFVEFTNNGDVFLQSTYIQDHKHRVPLEDILSFELRKEDDETNIIAVMRNGFLYPIGCNKHGEQKNLMRIAAIKTAHAETRAIVGSYE